jgi:two-component system, chemotaxis family, sensor kinase CheA
MGQTPLTFMEIDLKAILQTFVAECEEHFAKMEESLVALETKPQDDKLLDAIFRGAHTLKGNSASLGYPKVAGFAHAFEGMLQRFRDRTLPITPSRITLLLLSLDAMRQMVPAAIAGGEELQPQHIELLNQLAGGGPNENLTVDSFQPIDLARRSFGGGQADPTAWIERTGTIRVDTKKLDRMLDLAGEITIAQGRLRQAIEHSGNEKTGALEAQDQVERLSLELQENIMKVRMVPVGPAFRQYIRTVRDVAQSQGKCAQLTIEGEDVEVDVSVIEHLKDPLTHMIRNALDHGIEQPEARKTFGKDPSGTISLKAFHEGANIVIQVSDDGAGLKRDKIIERAKIFGTVVEPDKLADQELYRMIFEPGFTTADGVTDLSGRGVGMDVVRRNIEALRGSVGVDSEHGKGTTITIRLPLTLAIIEGFGVGIGEDTYVLPLHAVSECIEMPVSERSHDRPLGVINLRGEPLPYVRLRDWFELTSPRPDRENIVVVELDGTKAGLAVDSLHGARQTVIKSLGDQFRNLPGISGSAILGNGRVALILDISALLRKVRGSSGNCKASSILANRNGEVTRKELNSVQYH